MRVLPLSGSDVPLELVLVYFEALGVPPGACGLFRNKQLLVSQAGHKQACSVPTTGPRLRRPPSQAPLGAAFVADSIRFHKTWKRTRDTCHCPPISHVQDYLQTALRRSPRPTPNSRSRKHHCLSSPCLFPADLPVSREM